MKVLSAESSWLNIGDIRLDASFHLSAGRISKIKIDKSPYHNLPLSRVTEKIYNGARFKRYYVQNPEKGIAFMGISDMLKSELNDLKYISKKLTKNPEALRLKKGWILVSCSGTIGNTVFTNEDYNDKAASQHILRVIPNNKVLGGCLYAYLSSTYGYSLMTQGTYGGVIRHIEPQHIKDIPVPDFPRSFQEKIHDLILKSAELKEKATTSLAAAHAIFQDNIFKNSGNVNARIDLVDFNTITSLHQTRFDATFYLNLLPIQREFSQEIEYKNLGTLVKQPMFTANRGKRVYVKKGIKFLSTSEIAQSNPLRINNYLSLKTDGLKSLVVKKDWILVSRSGQEILGSCFLVDNTYHECGVNEHSLRVVIDETKVASHYVFAFLSHPKIKDYIRAGIYGSAILTINEDYLELLKIPILSDKLSKKIVDHILFYQQYKEESCKLEFEAIKLIENEIELWQK